MTPLGQTPIAWMIWFHGNSGVFDNKVEAEWELERRNTTYPEDAPLRRLIELYPPADQDPRACTSSNTTRGS